jgi:hypothetical protein
MTNDIEEFKNEDNTFTVYPGGILCGEIVSKSGYSFFEIPSELSLEIAAAITYSFANKVEPKEEIRAPKKVLPIVVEDTPVPVVETFRATPTKVHKTPKGWAANTLVDGKVQTFYYTTREKAREVNALHMVGEYGRMR